MISVLIPAYKAADFLEDCVQSVLDQNMKKEILIGVDHCEETYRLISSNSLIKKYCKIFNFEENVGTYLVLNSLISYASYNDILFFGADDLMFNGMLKEAIDNLANFDIVRWRYYNFRESIENKIDSKEHSPGAFATKKTLLSKLNGFFPWRMSADWEFQLRAKHNGAITFLSNNYFYRRLHTNNMTLRQDTGMKSDARKIYIDYIQKSTEEKKFLNPDKIHTKTSTLIFNRKEFNLTNKYKYDISIVMAFYNRKPQLLKTLDKFEKQYANKYNFEVIIVDDNSHNEHNLDDITQQYSFPIKLFRINKKNKRTIVNPCIAYNEGFKEANGKIILIQNPECYHVGDIIGHALKNLKEQDYFSYSCYTANTQDITDRLIKEKNPQYMIQNTKFNLENQSITGISWYNHPVHKPTAYHFCSAIYNSKLKLLGGFDESFAEGYCFDDCELVLSVKNNLQLNIKIIDSDKCFVIHQFHEGTGCRNISVDVELFRKKRLNNKKLYDSIKNYHEEKIFSYPKLLHLYWDGSPLSFLNLITVLSFNKYHKFWKINIYTPTKRTETMSWKTNEQKTKYTGKCYFHRLYDIPNVFIYKIDFDEIGFNNNASEVIKSDYLRYYLLQKHGGVWSDFDIIYTSNIENKLNFVNKNTVIFKCSSYHDPKNKKNLVGYKYFPIGFFACTPSNSFFQYVLNMSHKYYDSNEYQSIGASMWEKVFKPNYKKGYVFNKNIEICNEEYYMPYAYNELDELFVKENNILPSNNIGIHWFNGSPISKKYVNDLDQRLDNFQPMCFIDRVIKEYIIQEKQIKICSILPIENIKYSIVLPYYKRYHQFKQTLVSYKKHYYNRNDFEILIGEDYKNAIDTKEHERLLALIKEYKDIKIRVIDTHYPNVYNPCLSFNHCVSVASGEFIVISNPECFHENNILNGFDTELKRYNDVYVVSSCLAVDRLDVKTKQINYIIDPSMESYCNGWLQHSIYNNRMFHFCSCISKKNFSSIGGFDVNFQYGISWEDNDFINKIKKSDMAIRLRDDLKVLHIHHHKNYQLKNLIETNSKYYHEKWK